jgi:hypothetical protein
MVQLGEMRCAIAAPTSGEGVGRARTGMAPIIAALMAGVVLATPAIARAQDAPAQEPGPPNATASEKADCEEQLVVAERALEKDYYYARNWSDAWYVVGGSLMGLSLTSAFTYHDYRRGEQLVGAFQSLLLIIQVPTAISSKRTLRGIRSAEAEDPCLALADTRFAFEANYDDWKQHAAPANYVIAAVIPLLGGLLVGLSTQHWDFAGHGAEGLSTLVGLTAGELQVATYPHGSLHVGGTSLTMTF